MKNSLIRYTILSLFFTLASCQRDLVEIKMIGMNSQSDTLIFNSQDTIITNKKVNSLYLAPYRKHTFTLNNSKPIIFNVKGKGGILNIYNDEFVIHSIKYIENNLNNEKYDNVEVDLPYCIMIDSFLVFEKKFKTYAENPIELNKIISEISGKKNGNYKTTYHDRQMLIEGGDYDTLNTMDGFKFKKIGKDKIFIEKFWEYDIDEKIPEEINVKVRKGNVVQQNRVKNAIMYDKDFLRNAKTLQSKFYVIDVSNKLK